MQGTGTPTRTAALLDCNKATPCTDITVSLLLLIPLELFCNDLGGMFPYANVNTYTVLWYLRHQYHRRSVHECLWVREDRIESLLIEITLDSEIVHRRALA